MEAPRLAPCRRFRDHRQFDPAYRSDNIRLGDTDRQALERGDKLLPGEALLREIDHRLRPVEALVPDLVHHVISHFGALRFVFLHKNNRVCADSARRQLIGPGWRRSPDI